MLAMGGKNYPIDNVIEPPKKFRMANGINGNPRPGG
jgi:hypothetical protein